MDGRRRRSIRRFANGVLACLLGAFLFGWIFDDPEPRKYPEREPVVFWHMWTAGWKANVEEICTRFNESQTLYEVIPLSLPHKVADSKLLLSVAGGEPPDCMAQWHQVVPQFAEGGLIAPLDEIMTAEELASFRREAYPVAEKIARYKGRLYCMPLAMDVRACYYRLDHLHKAGLVQTSIPAHITSQEEFEQVGAALPETLEELIEWGAKLHVFDDRGRLVRLGFMPQEFRMFAPVFGGGFYDWQKEKVTINTPENLRALTYLKQQHDILAYDRMQRFTSSLAAGHGADWPFAIGKRSITIDGQWRVQQLQKYAPDLPYATSPIPPPKEGGKKKAGWVHGNFMIIPRGAKNPKGAWAFTKFWLGYDDPDRAAEFYTRSGWLPPSPQIAETARYRAYVNEHPQFQTFIDVLASRNIEPTPPVPFQLHLFDLIGRTDESVMRGSLTPQEALELLAEDIREIQRRQQEADDEK